MRREASWPSSVNTLMARRKAGELPEPEAVPEDVVILGEIRDLLKTR
jgi:large-conductance mechanosensitive channel